MIFRIYLIISIITLLLFTLFVISGYQRAKNKYKKLKMNRPETGKCSLLFSYAKIVIISFTPIFNVIMLGTLIFSKKLEKRADEIVDKSFENMEGEKQ